MTLLALGGCLDRLLEAPYILTSGLGEARSIAISREGDLIVAGTAGLTRITADGSPHLVDPVPTDAIAVSPNHRYALRAGHVDYEGTRLPVPGAVDIAATWNPDLWVLYPDRVEIWDPDRHARTIVTGLSGARALTLGPQDEMLVTLPTEVRAYRADGRGRTLVTGLVNARFSATDEPGRVYVVQGDEPELFRVDDGTLTRIARFLDDPRDLQFGRGQSLVPTFAYLATASGRVDYVQVPF